MFFKIWFSFLKISITDSFDWIASTVIIASIVVGLVQVGGELGSVSDMIGNALNEPQKFGIGSFVYYVGLDSWTPGVPKTFLDQYGLGFLTAFYWYAGGEFTPHYSLWTLLFSLIFTIVATWLTLAFTDWDFWYEGLGLAFLFFVVGWWLWGLISWNLMFLGGSMIGFSGDQVYSIWHATVTATQTTILQWFFLALVPISAIWLGKKVVGAVV